jgi:hypothetical protein
MTYFFLEPEVGGNIVCSETDRNGLVRRLHYEFDGYEGSAIVESVAHYLVTEEAKGKLEAIGATGIGFDRAETSTSDLFDEMYPGERLPKFVWLKIMGRAGEDDFGMAQDKRLVVSGRVLELFKRLGLDSVARINDYP